MRIRRYSIVNTAFAIINIGFIWFLIIIGIIKGTFNFLMF